MLIYAAVNYVIFATNNGNLFEIIYANAGLFLIRTLAAIKAKSELQSKQKSFQSGKWIRICSVQDDGNLSRPQWFKIVHAISRHPTALWMLTVVVLMFF